MKFLIAIVGPTAIGKTALSIQLAQHFGCEIVSCDSRQFFREMSIGTAVPDHEELASVRHHFIHNKSVFDEYTVGDYEREAIEKLDRLFESNDCAILVGGSGLYVDAILKGFDYFPEIDLAVREKVLKDYELHGIVLLQDRLQEYDPEYYQKIAKENPQTLLNPQRMMRFVEVCMGTGKPYSSFLNLKKNTRRFTPIVIALEADRETMYDRINRRVMLMIDSGLIEEAKALYESRKRNALQTVGYRELFAHFEGEMTLEAAIAEIKKNTRRFAKRQLTWFKRNDAVAWFDYQTASKEIIDYILEIINKHRI